MNRAFLVVRRVTGTEQWERLRLERLNELLVQFALSRFRRRPKFGALPSDLQLDVRDFFSSYKEACEIGESLLFSAGDLGRVDKAIQESPIGKRTQDALYVHVDALHRLDPLLRVYEGCARAFIGAVEGANLVKLHRERPRISYLSYPEFDRDPHPALARSVVVDLRIPDADFRNYEGRENPPILHRKETFLAPDDPRRPKFEKLTEQEERYGLYETPVSIGTREGWNQAVSAKGLRFRGHRLVRDN